MIFSSCKTVCPLVLSLLAQGIGRKMLLKAQSRTAFVRTGQLVWIMSRNYCEVFKTLALVHGRPLSSSSVSSTGSDVLLVDEHGVNMGLLSMEEAEQAAKSKGMQMIQVGWKEKGNENNVFKLVARSESRSRASELAITQTVVKVKEMTMRSQISERDLELKLKKIREFLGNGWKVTVKIAQPGRATTSPRDLLDKILENLGSSHAKLEGSVKRGARSLTCIIRPSNVANENR